MYKLISSLTLAIVLFTGCSFKDQYKTAYTPLEASNIASYELSYMKRDYEKYLLERISDKFRNLYMPGSKNVLTDKIIAVSSLVDVNDFSKTSKFGRLFSDLMLTDLERSGWEVLDIRGTNFKIKNKKGEFYLSRSSIKNLPKNTIFLVGTYSKYNEGLILNIRLIDPQYNKLLSSTSLLLKDKQSYKMSKYVPNDSYIVKIIQDDCTIANNCKE